MRAQARDPDRARRIEPAAPLDRVRQQLAERLRHRFAHVVRQLGVELHHEILQALRDLERARRDELQPLGPRRHDLDRQAAAADAGQHVVDDLDDPARRERLAHERVRLPAKRLQQRLRRVVGGHHHDARRRGAASRASRQHVEAAHARQPDVEQHQVDRLLLAAWRSASGPSPACSVLIAGVLQQRRDARGAAPGRRRRPARARAAVVVVIA